MHFRLGLKIWATTLGLTLNSFSHLESLIVWIFMSKNMYKHIYSNNTCLSSRTMATYCKGLMYWFSSNSSFSCKNSKNSLTLEQNWRGEKSFSRFWNRSCNCGIMCWWTFNFNWSNQGKKKLMHVPWNLYLPEVINMLLLLITSIPYSANKEWEYSNLLGQSFFLIYQRILLTNLRGDM